MFLSFQTFTPSPFQFLVTLFGDRSLGKDPVLNGEDLDNVQYVEQVAPVAPQSTGEQQDESLL